MTRKVLCDYEREELEKKIDDYKRKNNVVTTDVRKIMGIWRAVCVTKED